MQKSFKEMGGMLTVLLAFGSFSSVHSEIIRVQLPDKMIFNIDTNATTAEVAALVPAAAENPDLVLPDEITYEGKSYKVTKVGKKACLNNGLLQSIKFGKYITEVDSAAFDGSNKLVKVEMNDAVRKLASLAFGNCTSLETVTGLEYTTEWGDYTFQGAKALTEFTVPKSVTKIGLNPFRSCSALKTINVENGNPSYISVDGVLFDKEKTLLVSYPVGNGKVSYAVPAGVKIIGAASMRNNAVMISVTFPSSLEEIGDMALGVCGLRSIEISSGVKTIGAGAFFMNNDLESLTVSSDNPFYKAIGGVLMTKDGKTLVATTVMNGEFTVPAGIENIGAYAFYGQSGLTGVTFSSSIKKIGDNSFYNCANLRKAVFNDGLETIGRQAFQNCRMLAELSLPASVRVLDYQSFTYCSGLTKVVLNDGLEEIGPLAFYGCSLIPEITIPGTVRSFGNSIFYNCTSLTKAVLGEGLSEIPSMCFAYCKALISVNYPASLKKIDSGAMYQTSVTKADLKEGIEFIGDAAFELADLTGPVVLPNSVKTIDNFSFSWNAKMTSFTCGTGLINLEHHALHMNESLENVILNEGLQTIGANGISVNQKLKTLTIPSTVMSIDSLAVNFDTSMTDLYMLPVNPPATNGRMYNVDAWDGYSSVTLHVPSSSLDAYKAHEEWGKYVRIQGDLSGISTIEGNAELTVKQIYDINGNCVSDPVPGTINILRMSDGSVRKIMVPLN